MLELFIQCNKDSCREHITGGVNIYIYIFMYGCVSLLAPECVFVCVISNLSTIKNCIMCQTSVSVMPCCIKHAARSFCYYGTKARYV